MNFLSLLPFLLALVLAPMLPGIINKTKAFYAGRQGPPLAQLYFDLGRLLRKGAVYSETTGWLFRAGPVVGLGATLVALAFVPLGGIPALIHFDGDLILVAYLLGLGRFFTVLAALDTGSSFEGMGASREVQFSALAEPGFLLGLLVLAVVTGHLSLTGILADLGTAGDPALLIVFMAFLMVYLAENSRIPVDDPTTHLELTMVHEVMILDHSGPDLALIEYGSALKLWLLGALVMATVTPTLSTSVWWQLAAGAGGLVALAILVGMIESSMARARLLSVPRLLVAAIVLATVALFLVVE